MVAKGKLCHHRQRRLVQSQGSSHWKGTRDCSWSHTSFVSFNILSNTILQMFRSPIELQYSRNADHPESSPTIPPLCACSCLSLSSACASRHAAKTRPRARKMETLSSDSSAFSSCPPLTNRPRRKSLRPKTLLRSCQAASKVDESTSIALFCLFWFLQSFWEELPLSRQKSVGFVRVPNRTRLRLRRRGGGGGTFSVILAEQA